MEVGPQKRNIQNHQRNNLNNVRVPTKGQMPHKLARSNTSTAEHEFHDSDPDKKNSEGPSEEETRQQTVKILTEFIRDFVLKNNVIENMQRGSAHQSEVRSSASTQGGQNQVSSTTGRRKQASKIVPLRQESNDDKLYKVMSGQARHQSDLSLGSSDSMDSVMTESFKRKRNKSFSKAVRHSIVTELENKSSTKVSSRRNSEDIRQTRPPATETATQEHDTTDSKKAGSPISHTRASSDSAVVNFDVTGKHQRQISKEKKNKKKSSKGFFWSRKKKDKKLKDSIDEYYEAQGSIQHNQREGRKSEKRTHSKEDRRSPSPPSGSTPKLLRKFSKRIFKSDKPEPREKSHLDNTETRHHREFSKHTGRSKSLEFDSVETDGVQSNGDAKSNSLPMKVRLSVKPPIANSQVKPSNSDAKYRENVRPTTLDIPKKKSKSTFGKFSKLFSWHSSSSSSSDSESEDETPKSPKKDRKGRSLPEESIRNSIRHSNSANKERSVADRKEMYQHRATKSMSDVDPLEKNCKEIARRLRIVAEKSVQHYHQPEGRSQTPDSYRHQMKKNSKPGKKSRHQTKPASFTAPSPTKVRSQSMKAYLNMQSNKQRKNSETQSHNRITRDEVDHGMPAADAPRHFNGTNGSATWSDKVGGRGMSGGNSTIDSHESTHRTSSTQNGHHTTYSSSSRTYHYHKDSDSALPSPKLSSSPPLRPPGRSPNRHRGPSLDDNHHRCHIERDIDITTTASSPRGTRRIHRHTHISADVEPDASGIGGGDGDDKKLDDDDFTGFMLDEDDTDVVEERQEKYTMIEETDNYTAPRAPLMRQRAATTPEMPTNYDDLDGDEEEDEEVGAVGGEEPVNMEKLADEIAYVLRNKGDKINRELETPQIEEAIHSKLKQFSEEKVKEIFSLVASKISTTSRNHPEVVQVALLFDMAGLFYQITRQTEAHVSKFFSRIITPIVLRMGGWSTVQDSLDETELEVDRSESEEPGTSGMNNHRKPPNRHQSNSSDSDLD